MSNSSLWQTLLAACQQDEVDPDFNEANFPLEPVAPDEAEWEVYEHHFLRTVRGRMAFRGIERLGYRYCGPRRAMEFVAAHPDLQLDHPLVVTARWQDLDGNWYAPVFYRDDDERDLRLGFLAYDFGPRYARYGWLVLRKRQK